MIVPVDWLGIDNSRLVYDSIVLILSGAVEECKEHTSVLTHSNRSFSLHLSLKYLKFQDGYAQLCPFLGLDIFKIGHIFQRPVDFLE